MLLIVTTGDSFPMPAYPKHHRREHGDRGTSQRFLYIYQLFLHRQL